MSCAASSKHQRKQRSVARKNSGQSSSSAQSLRYEIRGQIQDSKIKRLAVLIFHRMLCYGLNKWRWLIHWRSSSHRDQLKVRISRILKCWTREMFLLWSRSSRIPSSKRRSVSRNSKPKENQFLRGRQIAFMIYDYFRVTRRAHDRVSDCAHFPVLHFITIMFRNSIQDGTKFYYLCQRFHPMISWKVCSNW